MNSIVIAAWLWISTATTTNELRQVVKETEVTNDWDTAIALYNRGETVCENPAPWVIVMGGTTQQWLSATTNCMINANVNAYYLSGYERHKCPECTREHFDSYPRMNMVTKGIQKMIERNILKGTNQMATTIQYMHPHKKIETTTREKVIIQTNVTVFTIPMKEVIKTEKVWVEDSDNMKLKLK